VGIKRLLGQSPTGQLNEDWRERFNIVLPAGKAGDPPGLSPVALQTMNVALQTTAMPKVVQGTVSPLGDGIAKVTDTRADEMGTLREIIAVLRPGRHLATRQALEAAGVVSYTVHSVLGRSRQRGLKFKSASDPGQKEDVAIKFLPKKLFTIVVEESQVKAAMSAIIKANKTGKGQYGDGKIFVLDTEQAIRVSTDERGASAL
jgi:nitrogen regulatory protein PII 2